MQDISLWRHCDLSWKRSGLSDDETIQSLLSANTLYDTTIDDDIALERYAMEEENTYCWMSKSGRAGYASLGPYDVSTISDDTQVSKHQRKFLDCWNWKQERWDSDWTWTRRHPIHPIHPGLSCYFALKSSHRWMMIHHRIFPWLSTQNL
jgi:hypothetical protein